MVAMVLYNISKAYSTGTRASLTSSTPILFLESCCHRELNRLLNRVLFVRRTTDAPIRGSQQSFESTLLGYCTL